MAFLMSFPLMFRSKVGEMKFSMPQSLLAERGEGARGSSTAQRQQAALGGCDTPSALTGSRSLPPAAARAGSRAVCSLVQNDIFTGFHRRECTAFTSRTGPTRPPHAEDGDSVLALVTGW